MLLTENKISAVRAKAPAEHSQMASPEPRTNWNILRSADLPGEKQGLKYQTLKSDKANSSIHLRIASAMIRSRIRAWFGEPWPSD